MTMIIVTHEVLYEGVVGQGPSGWLLDHPCTNARGVSCAGSPMRKIVPPESDLSSGGRKPYMLGGG